MLHFHPVFVASRAAAKGPNNSDKAVAKLCMQSPFCCAAASKENYAAQDHVLELTIIFNVESARIV
jgi:hypothetical protein